MMLRVLIALLFFVVCLADDLVYALVVLVLVLVLAVMATVPSDLFVVTVVTDRPKLTCMLSF
jgi:hypothetical protein